MLLFVISFAIITITYVLLLRSHKYWIKKGVPQGNPPLIVGDIWNFILRKQSIAEMVQMVYNISPKSRYCGIYQFFKPTLVLRDPDLIKQITVKDFDYFVNHSPFVPEDSDPLTNKLLFSLKDQKWRNMRRILTPAFTIAKMKYMFPLISDTSEQFVKYFLKQDENVITIEIENVITRFANDVTANVVFGVKCDSLLDKNNEFYLTGRDATDFKSIWKMLILFGNLLMPQVYKYFKLSFFSKQAREFFRKLVQEIMDVRQEKGIVKPDMIQLLMEAIKTNKELTHDDLTAQSLNFFFGGFDSVSTVMCFMSYELAINYNIQQKLIREIDETLENCSGKLTYDHLIGMKYLDMVVLESLRKWPNAVFVDRICTKPYIIEPQMPHEQPVHLPKNAIVWIPIYALHRDPKYFSNPDGFDPERFNEENKNKIKPYSFLPFGSGQRSCIAPKFADLVIKILFFQILSHFEIVCVDKTQIPLKMSKKGINVTAENGFWLGLRRRKK